MVVREGVVAGLNLLQVCGVTVSVSRVQLEWEKSSHSKSLALEFCVCFLQSCG